MRSDEFDEIFRPRRSSAGPYTLDSPIRYEVWRGYALNPGDPADLLLEPAWEYDRSLREDLARSCVQRNVDLGDAAPALVGGLVAIRVEFSVFLEVIVPLTSWSDLIDIGRNLTEQELYQNILEAQRAEKLGAFHTTRTIALPQYFKPRQTGGTQDLLDRLRWFLLLAARIGFLDVERPRSQADDSLQEPSEELIASAASWLFSRMQGAEGTPAFQTVQSVSINRRAYASVTVSRNTIKVDAAERLFKISCADIGWAVLDSGIDARHPAFRKIKPDGIPYDTLSARIMTSKGPRVSNHTRVFQTYNLTKARRLLAGTSLRELESLNIAERLAFTKIDIAPEEAYEPPQHDHGTHVAGVLAANWIQMASSGPGEPSLPINKLMGICPDLQLWDLRVLGAEGEGDEFSVVAGLKLVEAINRRAGRLIIHGVNLSLALHHDVANYACGHTPVCNACRDLVDSGVVVVASAGNSGFNLRGASSVQGSSYQNISITDPGNGQDVITVGSTHGTLPYQYGVSYFSSRGPTADGRYKPDLLAPGEGITGPIPLINDVEADYKSYDGTSQAAAHVSGAAAMILARYPGMRGDPRAVKKALCESASDLGRERYFQGAGLVDILRALQSL